MKHSNHNTRGSIMIAALIITLVTGTLVGLFLQTVTQEVTNTHRARMGFQAVNLAEAGVEFAMHAMIQDKLDTNIWEKGSGGGYYRDDFGQLIDITTAETTKYEFLNALKTWGVLRNDNRAVRVYLEPGWVNAAGKTVPVAIAEGEVRLNNGILVRRQIRVEMEKGTTKPEKRGWGNGILGKDSVTFKGGNVFIDSYDSSTGDYDTTTNRKDNGSVASNAVEDDAVSISNATVVGQVATGGGDPGIGPNGSIVSLADYKKGVTGIDWDRVALDFYADLPDPEIPVMNSPLTSYSPGTIGIAGVATEYKLSGDIIVKNKQVLTIVGDVKLILNGNLNVGGEIRIAKDSSLEIYINGDADVGGNGIINLTNKPPNLLIYMTKYGSDFDLHGNGAFSGAVYAPNSEVKLAGGGGTGVMFGAVVGETIFFNGNYEFHYDEALANINPDNDEDGDYIPVVTGWRELHHADERISDWAALVQNGL